MKLRSLGLCFLSFNLFSCLLGMNTDVFKPTQKTKYSDGWRTLRGNSRDEIWMKNPEDYQKKFDAALNNSKSLISIIESYSISLNQPWIRSSPDRTHFDYFYPIEFIIFSKYPKLSLEKLLEYQPDLVQGFLDYNPVKDILLQLADPKCSSKELLIEYLKTFLLYPINLDKPLPDHNGFGPDTSSHKGCTARQLLDQTKQQWDQTIWTQVKVLFDKVPAPADMPSSQPQIPGHPSPPIPATAPSVKPIKPDLDKLAMLTDVSLYIRDAQWERLAKLLNSTNPQPIIDYLVTIDERLLNRASNLNNPSITLTTSETSLFAELLLQSIPTHKDPNPGSRQALKALIKARKIHPFKTLSKQGQTKFLNSAHTREHRQELIKIVNELRQEAGFWGDFRYPVLAINSDNKIVFSLSNKVWFICGLTVSLIAAGIWWLTQKAEPDKPHNQETDSKQEPEDSTNRGQNEIA